MKKDVKYKDYTNYVLGLLLSRDKTKVLLIRKNRPAWQCGMLNGIGGHVETTDAGPRAAMSREFKEETGIVGIVWTPLATIYNTQHQGKVDCFFAYGDIAMARSTTDEMVMSFDIDKLPANTIHNIRWLISMALYSNPSTPYIIEENISL